MARAATSEFPAACNRFAGSRPYGAGSSSSGNCPRPIPPTARNPELPMVDVELLALLKRLEDRAERSTTLCGLLTAQLDQERAELAAIQAEIIRIRSQATTCPPFYTNPRNAPTTNLAVPGCDCHDCRAMQGK